jgi:deoxyhypusine synthase
MSSDKLVHASEQQNEARLAKLTATLFEDSEQLADELDPVKGYDFNQAPQVNYDALFQSYLTTGFQASALGRAVVEVNRMLKWRLVDDLKVE